MNKKEMVLELAKKFDLSNKKAEEIFSFFLEGMKKSLVKGKKSALLVLVFLR